MSLANTNTVEADPDALAPIVAEIDELVADLGQRAVVEAILRSRCAEALGKMGGNAALRISQVLLRRIVYAKDSKMEAEILAMAAGMILEDSMTVTRLAKRYGLTKQAVSKRIVRFCEENGLPPSIYMRPARDRLTYAMFNKPRSR